MLKTLPGPAGATPSPNVPELVTRQSVQARTRELALLAGREAPHVLQADYEQAKRELTGTSEPERQEEILDANAGPTRSHPVPSPAR